MNLLLNNILKMHDFFFENDTNIAKKELYKCKGAMYIVHAVQIGQVSFYWWIIGCIDMSQSKSNMLKRLN